MRTDTFRFLSILFTALAMCAAFAHLFELPHKIHLSREEYLTVQQIYRGWNLLGAVVVGALVTTWARAILVRERPREFRLTLTAGTCIALSLALFFLFTFPVNRQTLNWTVSPENWQELRRQWEYSHAAGAGLYFIAFVALALSTIGDPKDGCERQSD